MLFILTIILGFLIINTLLPKWSFLEKFFLGYGLGMGITTTLMTILEFFDLLNLGLLYVIVIVSITPFLFKIKKTRPFSLNKIINKSGFSKSFWVRLSILPIIALLLIMVTSLLFWPIHAWDALTLYDFRARFLAGGGTLLQLSKMNYHYYFSYPLLTTNSHLMLYLEGLSNAKVIYVLFGLGLYFLFYTFVRKLNLNIAWSLLLTTLFASDPLVFRISKIAYTNLPYLYYLVVGIFFLYLWLEKKNFHMLLISSLMFAISTHVRFADMLYVLNVGFLLLLYILKKIKAKDVLIFTLPIIVLDSTWRYISLFFRPAASDVVSLSERVALGFSNFSIIRIQEVFLFYFDAMIKTYKMHTITFLIVVFISLAITSIRKKIPLGTIYLAYVFVAILTWSFAGNYFITFGYENWRRIAYSLQRLSLLIVPALLFFFADFINRAKLKQRHE